MAEKFSSLRKKLVLKLGLTYLFALLFVFGLIIVKNTLDFNDSIAETEQQIRSALINKGMLLAENNSNALVGLVDDNAFSAVELIVSKTVIGDSDIIYGIFSDREQNNWVYHFKNDKLALYDLVVTQNKNWAYQQLASASKSFEFEKTQFIEFAAPVLLNGESLGVIRYGLSTVSLTKTIQAATEKATNSLIQTLIGLTLVSIITLIITYWRTDNVARRITVPLNLLTDAANVVANGRYDQKINIKTNDEIGILANNFNLMTNTINQTIADLAEVNHIGGELAKVHDEIKAFHWVLQGLLKQLSFEVGFIFSVVNQTITNSLSHYPDSYADISAIVDKVIHHVGVKNAVKEKMQDVEFMHFDLSQSNKVNKINETNEINKPVDLKNNLSSFVLMPFGNKNEQVIYLVLLSHELDKKLDSSEIEFCLSIRHLLATSLQNIAMKELLEEQNRTLEDKVAHRTEELNIQNEALSETLKELEQAQNQLVEAEKMASLGSLVAGISHEVNTPLGVSVTAASHLNEQTQIFETKFNNGELTKSGFTAYLEGASEATEIILTNLDRAATLIQSFKQIAVDQSSDVLVEFNIMQHLDSLIVSLKPTYKSFPITINLIGDHLIEVISYPGLLTQIVTNLIVNSIKHGLKNCENGEIIVELTKENDLISIVVADNGTGIADEIKGKVFDPFFTTSRGTGGSGLGLNIVYNLVNKKLNGEIYLEDNQPKGSRFIVKFPSLKMKAS